MGNPYRILFICHDGDLFGSQQSLSLMVRHLPKEQYECFVSIARPGPLEGLLNSLPNVTVLRHKRLQWVKHDPRGWLQKIGDCLTLLISAVPRTFHLFNTIRRQKINVVHTNSTVSLEGPLAAALAGVPHVWHIRELFMEKSPKFHLVLGRRVSRWIIDRFSDAVFCISEVVRDQFGTDVLMEDGKYQLVYNALDTATHAEPLLSINDPQRGIIRALSLKVLDLPETKAFRLGYIGRLSEGKGFHELLEAFIQLRRRNLAVELVVAGRFVDDAYETRILNRIEEAGVGTDVHFLGYQSNLNPVHEVLDVLVVPSVNEPFGRVVIEAMIQGVPCVATNSGGIPEIIESGVTGQLYPPGDVYALVGILEEGMNVFWKLETIRQNARRMVCERFNIETQIRTLDACYQSIISRHQLL